MRITDNGPGALYSTKNKKNLFPVILTAVFSAALAVFIAGGVIAVKARQKKQDDSLLTSQLPDPSKEQVENLTADKPAEVSDYMLLGELRIQTATDPSTDRKGIAVVNPYFAYPKGDTAFFEELSDQVTELRNIFRQYFQSHTLNQLKSMGELAVKDQLLEQVNSHLALGKVTDIFFETYAFFE